MQSVAPRTKLIGCPWSTALPVPRGPPNKSLEQVNNQPLILWHGKGCSPVHLRAMGACLLLMLLLVMLVVLEQLGPDQDREAEKRRAKLKARLEANRRKKEDH